MRAARLPPVALAALVALVPVRRRAAGASAAGGDDVAVGVTVRGAPLEPGDGRPSHPERTPRPSGTAPSGTAPSSSAPPADAPSSSAASSVPRPDHVVVVVMENRSFNDIIGNPRAPYINGLAAGGALFTQSYAVAHPSQPNYLALFSGSTQGIHDDSCPHTFARPQPGRSLVDAGRSFAGYSEGLPSAGSPVCEHGAYARKHAPWVNFPSVPRVGEPAVQRLPRATPPRCRTCRS